MIEEIEKYRPLSWNEVNDWKFPDTSWWIKDLIPKNAFVIIASISGEGKSWSAYTMAKNISEGKNFLGKNEFQTNQGTVLYIDAENSPKEIQRRCRQLGYTDNENLLFLPVSDFNLNSEMFANKLKSIIAENHVDVVIVDTFRAVAGGLDENQANVVRQFYNRFKELRDNSTSFVFLDHYRKPNHFEGKVPRKEFLFGSQDKTAGVEILLMLKKEGDTIELHQAKNRVGKEIEPFKMELIDSLNEKSETSTKLRYVGSIEATETKSDLAQVVICRILNSGPLLRTELIDAVQNQVSIGAKNIDSAIHELIKAGMIVEDKDGKKNVYSLVTPIPSETIEATNF